MVIKWSPYALKHLNILIELHSDALFELPWWTVPLIGWFDWLKCFQAPTVPYSLSKDV